MIDPTNSASLYASLLNAQTLTRIGNIKIKWITNVSSHLLFDVEKKCLMLFGLPSFCQIYEYDNSTFANIVSNYYDNYSKPDKYSASQYFREMRRSYSLIFGEDKKAFKIYKSMGTAIEDEIGILDPFLTTLCEVSRGPFQSTKSNFPVLGPRLLELQQYIERQTTMTIATLWNDRRDMLRWYTFWLVTIIGGLGILLSVIQIILAAAQVQLSKPASKY